MNKDAIIRFLNVTDTEQIPKVKRIIELCEQASQKHDVIATGFLSPDLQHYSQLILKQFLDLNHSLNGGYPEAEYKILTLYPDYMTLQKNEVAIIEMTYNEKYGEIGHRDVLGAVLALGIKRDVIGDILLEVGRVHLLVKKDIVSYLLSQIQRIGRVTVKCTEISTDDIMVKQQSFVVLKDTVKSLRLDAVVASGLNISRVKAAELVKGDRVKLNHIFTNQLAKEVDEGDLISVQGKGRFILEEISGLSKKDRQIIKIKKFV